jgi:sialate O-acetylesterase
MAVGLALILAAISSQDATPSPMPLTITTATSRSFVSRTLGSSMVLQRVPQRSRLWGASTPKATVRVTLQPSGVEEVTTADSDGTWRVLLPPMAASLGHTLLIFSSSGENATLADIAFGDVFLCGGQSNMEFAVPAMTNASAEIAAADEYPHIRIFTVGVGTQSAEPLRDLQTVREVRLHPS